ncbi:hypothetical protein N431DRAFT_547717 [Stipitochalara longipes BDJ]|nr:hypothetical protein N431DRAFT_547717 [Stipitochalara longipes BDJ]
MTFNCPLCSKSYENNKQLTRHVRYCRAKVREGVSPRQKSCTACIKAKTRCDLSLPSCSQCTNKDRRCLYQFSNAPSNFGGSVGALVPRVDLALDHAGLQTASNDNLDRITLQREPSGHCTNDLCHLSASNSFDYTSSPNIWLDIRSKNSGIGDVDGIDSSDGMLDFISPPSNLWNFPSNTPFRPQFSHFKDRVILGSFYVISLSPSFVYLDAKTIIERRDSKAGPHGSALGRIYCMSILRSFPGMFCGNNGALPSFIHLQSRPSPSLQTDPKYVEMLPEPLAICSSIMRMYHERSPGNLAFVWRTIQAESIRIENEYRFYDTKTTLASIQAMTMYLILGLLDDDSEHATDGNILVPMLNTTKSMADTLRPSGWLCIEEALGDIPAWEEWVQAESRRRTAVILVLIIHIFNIEHGPGLPQCGGIAELPLPCSKTLWQASDRESWEVEYKRQYVGDGRGWRRVPTYRDLLPEFRDDREKVDLSEWFVGMDDLGSLVTMAVSTL